ncbi:MAG: histidine--tRNA ligase [Oscillospiraceae bacterium]|jgi:histidyl-tRNA synthetase|nr:histidine--tRNA ligase [Oscillospiraceae bacterium]
MALITKAVRGTRDVLPGESQELRWLERVALETAEAFGYFEIRTPVFEHTELFERSVGDTTDVVQKEMYTFRDKGDRSITLRPEGTAGVARACLEHGLLAEALPQKVSYITTCYRYEKPQSGRQREFTQFGVECFGAASPAADAELISLATTFYATVGLESYRLEINSIGCPACRAHYLDELRKYFRTREDNLCPTCLDRLDRNPMRILDCKSPICAAEAALAPRITEYLCEECAAHFTGVKTLLEQLEIPYMVNPRVVRGLDYYTRTVFEFVSELPQTDGLVIGAGGRYDGLIEELGGQHLPSLGFGLGLDRSWMHLRAAEAALPERRRCDLFLATRGETALAAAARYAFELRGDGVMALYDVTGRSLKAQMKYADKVKARFTAVLGEEELACGTAKLKHMADGSEETISLSNFAEELEQHLLHSEEASLFELFSGFESIKEDS